MFRPIKNLFTYIQKNTSGSSIFGSGSSGDGTTINNETNCKSNESPSTRDSNTKRSGLGDEPRPKGTSMESPKRASTESNKGAGMEGNKGAGMEGSKGVIMDGSKGGGLKNSKGGSVESSKRASTETSKAASLESTKGVGIESTKGVGGESTKGVGMESTKGVGTESTKRASTASGSVSKPSSTAGLYARLPLASGSSSDPDDIEMHIKSSIVVKGAAGRSPISTKSLNGSQVVRSDHNQNVKEKEPLEEVDEELHEFGQPHRVVVVEGPVLERDMFPLVAAKSANGELTGEAPGDSSYIKMNGGGSELVAEVNLDASLNSKDPLAIEEGEFDPNVSVSAVNFLNDEVVIEIVDEPETQDEDLISLDSPTTMWLSEPGVRGGEAFTEASTSSGGSKTRSSLTTATTASSSTTTSVTKLGASSKGRLEVAAAKVCDEDHPSDGSDSGLGSETSTLQNSTLPDSSAVDGCLNSSSLDSKKGGGVRPPAKPLRSNLKRRLADALSSGENGAAAKKPKRSINFEGVQVYYFQRQQGFGCVPSAGGCTLGMSATHSSMRSMTLTEHAAELRRAHRLQLQQQQEASRQRHSVASGAAAAAAASSQVAGSSSDDSEESEEDYLSEGSGSDLDGETNGFLQPVTPKQRRIILKAAGVRKIDASEKIECRNIRDSRDVCGCTCRDFCDPDTCACSQAGIKCQVDRASFPCGCSRDSCGNVVGRVEFNPDRVRTHFIHTLLRLNMENGVPPPPVGAVDITTSTVAGSSSLSSAGGGIGGGGGSSGGYYGMQSQSAYSSGYASPAYSGELQSYYQPQLMADTHHQQQQHTYSGATSGSNVAGPASVYQMDSLDSGLFGASSTNATPSYGELMPSYAATSTYAHAMGYDYGGGGGGQASSYGSYHHLHPHHLSHSHNHATHHHQHHQSSAATPYQTGPDLATNTDGGVVTVSAYQSCAVPSMPPYGSATTTTASSMPYPTVAAVTRGNIHNVAESAGAAASTAGGSSFINLSPPIASSSRLTQINDLLQHNRNTTAALVAVVSSGMTATNGGALDKERGQPMLQHMLSSINTPPIEDAQRSCLNFETLPSPLHPTPIVAVLADEPPRRLDENPPKPPSEPPPPPPPPQQQTPPTGTAIQRHQNEVAGQEALATKAKDTTTPGSASGSQQVSSIPRL